MVGTIERGNDEKNVITALKVLKNNKVTGANIQLEKTQNIKVVGLEGDYVSYSTLTRT